MMLNAGFSRVEYYNLTGGIVALVVGGVLVIVLILSEQAVWTRLLLFLPFMMSTLTGFTRHVMDKVVALG